MYMTIDSAIINTDPARETLQRAADVETIAAWEYHQRQLKTHRTLAGRHNAALIAIGSAYPAAVKREQRRYDDEHAPELLVEPPSANGHGEAVMIDTTTQ